MIYNDFTSNIFDKNFFSDEEKTVKSYDVVCWFFIQKLKKDLPFAKIDYYINSRNIRVVTISVGELVIGLELEFGYVEFCGIEYDFNLYDLVKLIKAIQHYIMKYSTVDVSNYIYIENPWGW